MCTYIKFLLDQATQGKFPNNIFFGSKKKCGYRKAGSSPPKTQRYLQVGFSAILIIIPPVTSTKLRHHHRWRPPVICLGSKSPQKKNTSFLPSKCSLRFQYFSLLHVDGYIYVNINIYIYINVSINAHTVYTSKS